jgi:pyruvate/2-oxoglutarate dehydrogenase complex dihydrolipoamide dehydrogenase (E3) component
MGGDCLNYGCVPSKALLAAAKRAHQAEGADRFGINLKLAGTNYSAAKDHVAEVIAQIAPVDSQERFEGFGVRVIRAFGKFVASNEVEAGQYRIRARRVVIATGSRPFVPPIEGLEDVPYLTNETVFDLREKPDHLLIIGGGPIGIEMAQAHRRLGCEVTVIEGAKALGKDDPETAAIVLDRLRAEGIGIIEDAPVTRIEKAGTGISVTVQDGQRFEGSHLLIAVGRKSNTENLNLSAAGIETTKTGIRVDDGLRTSNRRVYAIGDVAGGMQFTHVAGYHAGVIIRSLLFALPAKAKTSHIPWATYTDPEIAQVGLTEAQARAQHGDRVEVARFEFHHNDRAIAERVTEGFIKVMVVKGRPVGVSIVGHQAAELIGLWSLAIANRLKMSQIAAMVSPYPSIGEINKRAAGAYFSPRLFDNPTVKRVIRLVQKWIP